MHFDDEGTLLMAKYVFYGHGRSWHVVRTPTRMFDTYITLCGRTITTRDTMNELPQARSCETCLRIEARRDDRADALPEDDGSTQPELVP